MSLPTANNSNAPGLPPEASTPTAGDVSSLPPYRPQASGAQLRDDALDRIARIINPAWKNQAEAAMLAAIDRLGAATVDDARDAIPAPTIPCWWCFVTKSMAARGIIECVGLRPGVAKVTHAGVLRLWARKGTA